MKANNLNNTRLNSHGFTLPSSGRLFVSAIIFFWSFKIYRNSNKNDDNPFDDFYYSFLILLFDFKYYIYIVCVVKKKNA